jgi:pimeloyl-ACP methyl ester carboxylesterase
MRLTVDGNETLVATGGRAFDAKLPALVFLHGAGLDHTVWALLARWFSHRGFAVLAPDLPGHGRSAGAPLASVAAMADWTIKLLDAAGAGKAGLIGHSMGSLVALEAAARHGARVSAVGLVGTAPGIPVAADLLNAAANDDHAAIDMVSIWGHGFRAGLGGSLAPGLWMQGGGSRLLERAPPGVLHADLAACNAYGDGLKAAAAVAQPAIVVIGERDLMTPARSGRQLADALPNARLSVLKGAGHMLMSERPDEVLTALRDFPRG